LECAQLTLARAEFEYEDVEGEYWTAWTAKEEQLRLRRLESRIKKEGKTCRAGK